MGNLARRELLSERDQRTTEGVARGLVWAMDDLLTWEAEHPRAGMHVIRSRRELAELWIRHGGADGAIPDVDFEAQMVVAIFLDEGSYRRSPGIQRIDVVGNEIRIYYAFSERPWAMINPSSVVKVARADGHPVFVDTAGSDEKGR